MKHGVVLPTITLHHGILIAGRMVAQSIVFLANLTDSRTAAKLAIRKGLVRFNGRIIDNPDEWIDVIAGTVVELGGQRIQVVVEWPHSTS